MEITHQKQPDSTTCTSACLAMLIGILVDIVVKEFHEDYCQQKATAKEYLKRKGLKVYRCYADKCPQPGELLLATVPSLNKDATLHHIILDLRGDLDVVYDPNKGIEGKRYYVSWSDKPRSPQEVNLKHCVCDMEIVTDSSW